MRYLLVLSVLVMGISCSQGREDPRVMTFQEAQKFYKDSIAYVDYMGKRKSGMLNCDTFFAVNFSGPRVHNYLDKYLFSLEEPFVDTTALFTQGPWLRVTLAPSFGVPHCIVIEKKPNRTILTAKMTDGLNLHTGWLALETQQTLEDSVVDQLFETIESVQMDTMSKTYDYSQMSDGEGWFIEYINHGKYIALDRNSPYAKRPHYASDHIIAAEVQQLIRTSKIKEHYVEVFDSSQAFYEWIRR